MSKGNLDISNYYQKVSIIEWVEAMDNHFNGNGQEFSEGEMKVLENYVINNDKLVSTSSDLDGTTDTIAFDVVNRVGKYAVIESKTAIRNSYEMVIYKSKDEWFYVIEVYHYKDIKNDVMYKCDQFSGLIEYLNSRIC